MNFFERFYRREPYAEGIASTFDLYGNNSSFKDQVLTKDENAFVVESMNAYFQEVGDHLRQAIYGYERDQRNK